MITYERHIDQLGRVVIPEEIRRKANIDDRDTLIITCEKDVITLRREAPHKRPSVDVVLVEKA